MKQPNGRTANEAAELVLRSMIADMRSQGLTVSDKAADEMVAKIKAQILAQLSMGSGAL